MFARVGRIAVALVVAATLVGSPTSASAAEQLTFTTLSGIAQVGPAGGTPTPVAVPPTTEFIKAPGDPVQVDGDGAFGSPTITLSRFDGSNVQTVENLPAKAPLVPFWGRQLWAGPPAISADGGRFAYASLGISVVDIAGTPTPQTLIGPGTPDADRTILHLDWAPSGQEVFGIRLVGTLPQHWQVVAVSVATGALRVVYASALPAGTDSLATSIEDIAGMAVSPDGLQVAVAVLHRSAVPTAPNTVEFRRSTEILLVPATGGGGTSVYASGNEVLRDFADPNALGTVRTAFPSPKPILTQPPDSDGDIVRLAWSPNGAEIAFAAVQTQVVGAADDQALAPASSAIYAIGGAAERLVSQGGYGPITWTGPAAPVPVISSGPSGNVASLDATFAFGLVGAGTGHFECRVDSAAFATCTSPKSFNGLAQGGHSFNVRFVPDATGVAGPAATRTWTVDTLPPQAIIESGPQGTGAAHDVTFAFTSTEPEGATFRCALDAGPAAACSSPKSLLGLPAGPHEFAITAIDAAGNEQAAPTLRSFSVSAGGAQTVSCGAGTTESVTFGVILARALAPDACFGTVTFQGRQVRASQGLVEVNGLAIDPDPNGRVIVDGSLGNGTVRIDGGARLKLGAVAIPLQDTVLVNAANVTGLNTVSSIAEGLQELAGLPIAGGVEFEFAAEHGGQTKVTFKVKLPKAAFSTLPLGAEELSAEVPITVSHDQGLTGGLKLQIGEAWLFRRFKVKDFAVGVDFGEGSFAIEGEVLINKSVGVTSGGEPDGTGISFALEIEPGPQALFGVVKKASLAAEQLNRPIGEGFFLQRVGFALSALTDGGNLFGKFAGLGTISWGPHVEFKPLFEGTLLSLDGEPAIIFPASVGASGDWRLEYTGAIKILETPVEEGTLTWKLPDQISMTGKIDLSIAGYGLVAEIREASLDANVPLSASTFAVRASGAARLFGFEGNVDALFFNQGFAACFGDQDGKVGFGKRWGQDIEAFGDTCDVDAFRVAAASAQAGGARRATVGAGHSVVVLAIDGAASAPKVDIAGPAGFALATPTGPEAVTRTDAVLIQDTIRHTTFAILRRPKPGTYVVAPRAGESITRLRTAQNLPALKVAATVTRRGARRVLRWTSGPIPGQRLRFVERTAAGQTQTLATTTRRSGQVAFTPLISRSRSHRIEVLAARTSGAPRAQRIVARFVVTPPRRAGRAQRIALRSRALTWRLAGVHNFAVSLRYGDGTSLALTSAKPSVRLPRALAKNERLTVKIAAIDALGRPGPMAIAKFGGPKPKPKAKRAARR